MNINYMYVFYNTFISRQAYLYKVGNRLLQRYQKIGPY